MQSLLSRSGLAHRCYCRSCGTVAEAFGASGRAAARPRRRPTFAEIFTACYSSVFATAALVDAIRKDDRRQSLDRRLEEARRDLADLQERRADDGLDGPEGSGSVADPRSQPCPHPQFLQIHQMDALWMNLKGVLNNRPYMKEIHRPATIPTSALVESLKRDYYGCHLDGASRRQIDYEQLERAIAAEESDKRLTYRQPQKPSHLRMETISTEELVLKFLDRAKFLPKSDCDLPSPSFDEACRIMRRGYPQYTFRAVDPAGAHLDTAILNERLRTLIAAPDLGMSMRERIGRVCYNLLVCAYPPDMHTYNTLIVAFNRSGHHTFAEALVSSFFHSRLLQPTPSTYVAILNHYQCTNNHGKFLRALACLTGMEPKSGGKIRRRHVSDIELSPVLQRWAADLRRRTRTGEWVWEHIPMTQPLVEEILRGLLHFKLFDQAVAFFFTSLHAGVALSIRTARLVLDECVDALDWRAAARAVRSLTMAQERWRRLLLSADPESRRLLAARVRALIDLCGLHGLSQPERRTALVRLRIFAHRYARFLEMMEREAPLPAGALGLHDRFDGAKSRLLQLESIGKDLDYVGKTTMSIESKLLNADFSHGFRASMALRIGEAALQRSAQLGEEAATLLSGLGVLAPEKPTSESSTWTPRICGLKNSAEARTESTSIPEQGPSEAARGGGGKGGHSESTDAEPVTGAVAGQMRRAADSRPGGPLIALPIRRDRAEHVETS